jgi:general secretion pathway protein M
VDALRNWLDQLEPRERLLVLLASALMVLAIIVIGGLRPLLASADRNAQRVDDQQQLLTEIEQVAARLGPQRGGNVAAADGDSLVLVVDRSTRARNLGGYLKRNQPDGDATIRLRFERAPFDDLVAWLGELQNQYSISVVSANIDASNETGRVNCNLILSRATG